MYRHLFRQWNDSWSWFSPSGIIPVILIWVPYTELRLFYQIWRVCNRSFLAHLAIRPVELLPSLFVRRPPVNISHFNLLLRNHWANCKQTLVESSLGGPLPNQCQFPISNKDGHKARNRKKGDEIKKSLLL